MLDFCDRFGEIGFWFWTLVFGIWILGFAFWDFDFWTLVFGACLPFLKVFRSFQIIKHSGKSFG